jgi:hypothetical protein
MVEMIALFAGEQDEDEQHKEEQWFFLLVSEQ